jgi:hypothetical protein
MTEDQIKSSLDSIARDQKSMAQWQSRTDTRLDHIESRLTAKDILDVEAAADRKATAIAIQLLTTKVDDTNGNVKWAVRLILGGLILAVLGLVLERGGV